MSVEKTFEALPLSRSPRESEERVLESWRKGNIFQESLRLTAGGKPFVFYEGPPTANGMPHHGHLLTRVIKDLFPRYKTMDGFAVARKAGWDTHGLPVEVEVEKQIGSKRKQDIEKYGVDKFVELCKKSVWKYQGEWERLTERIGFWLDLEHPYVTYHSEFVDSVWWALSELSKKGLLKRGYKILPWCPVCQTGLSAAEVGLGYQEVADPALTVAFKVKGEKDTYVLAWTTTPWTLVSNVALVVGPEIDYVQVRSKDRTYWLAASRVEAYKKELGEVEVLATKKGKDLVGLRYEPLFSFAKLEGDAHKVVSADFVTTGDGTGIVHAAPAFGEDDYKVCKANNLAWVQLVGPDGTFKPECGPFAGKWIKDADPEIIADLKSRKLVVKHDQYLHDYPHCWRTNNPLIYYAREAWFIETTARKQDMVAINSKIAWAPEHIRDGRFGQFLEENRDWNVSRERFWATPLPVWSCAACGIDKAVGSRSELVALGALRDGKPVAKPEDIEPHRPHVDEVTLVCTKCKGQMKRDPSVIDCWFDSGSMPFAQWGYPHVDGSKEKFEANFPADFICEAIDQTRGWFYTLHAISTLLFNKPAYQRCLVLGHVMTRVLTCKKCEKQQPFDKEKPLKKCPEKNEKGAVCNGPLEPKDKKLSKKDKNYKPVADVLDEHGADAVRWFFLSKMSPGQPVVWADDGVRDARRVFLLKILNVYSFFQEYATLDGFDPRRTAKVSLEKRPALDRWIVSVLNSTIRDVRAALDAYDFHTAAAKLEAFVEGLSNWHVRRSRERAWSAASAENVEKWSLWWTLHEVLVTLAKLVAPFVPFMSEDLHRVLVRNLLGGKAPSSVHHEPYPKAADAHIDRELEERMDLARNVAALGKTARLTARLKVRQPLRLANVLLPTKAQQDRARALTDVIADELNVKQVEVSAEFDRFVSFEILPNLSVLGRRLGPSMKALQAQLGGLSPADASSLASRVRRGETVEFTLDGKKVPLAPDDLVVRLKPKEGFVAAFDVQGVVLVLDAAIDECLRLEALAADVKSAIQGMRKQAGLAYDARIEIAWSSSSPSVAQALDARGAWLSDETLGVSLRKVDDAAALEREGWRVLKVDLEDGEIIVAIREARGKK